MAILNYKFVASGALIRSKAVIYPFVPSRKPTNAIDWSSGEELRLESGKISKKANFDYNGYVFNQKLFLTLKGRELVLEEVAISVNLQHRIVTTEVVGMQGTVKEYTGAGDYDISISCAIVSVDEEGNITDDYPEDGVEELLPYLTATEALEVFSDLFDLLGFNKMVITSYSIEPNEQTNRQIIEIKALSDSDYTIFSQ